MIRKRDYKQFAAVMAMFGVTIAASYLTFVIVYFIYELIMNIIF